MSIADSKIAAAPNARPRRARARGKLRPFLAIDGESVDVAGEHRYIVMTSSSGDTATDEAGLSTRACLEFLIRQARDPAKPILVAFGWNYDVNMILRDLDREQLEALWTTGIVELDYPDAVIELEWIPSKLFSVFAEHKATGLRANAKVYDVFGFFQSSFVNALKSWGLGEDLDFIAAMKEKRGEFDPAELAEITRYSIEECERLVEMMNAVRDALHAVELRPRTWLGAGAIASTLLSRENVDEHLGEQGSPALSEAIMRAYFGGRTEVFRQGVFATAVAWDINSAYPAAALELPSMIGRWKRARDYDPSAEFAIWRCSWNVPEAFIAPFPFRDKRSIFYPTQGEGYYHASELAAARLLYGERIVVTSGYIFEPADPEARPFAFLAEQYDYRQELKAAGHPGEKVLKLGINSVYGKLAQGNSRDGRRPRFQSYYWAGKITADTRARALLAAAAAPEAIVAIATDGLVFGPENLAPNLGASKGLGGWERTRYRGFFVAQPGMYHAYDRATNNLVKHSRGFFTKEIDFPKLKRVWLERGPLGSVECNSHRFVGLGSALMRTDFDVWRRWEDGKRRISLYSSRKDYDDLEAEPAKVLRPPGRVRAGLSDIYVPKRAVVELDPDAEEWVQGTEQPLRVF